MNNLVFIKKNIKIKHLIILILLLVANSFAWFIYATRVDTSMDAHVRGWEVLFQAGDSPIIDYVNLNITNMCPGMEEYFYEIKASNRSEVAARLTYTLLEVNILGESIITIEGKNEKGQQLSGTELSSEELLTKLKNDYPFTMNFLLTSEEMEAEFGMANFQVIVNWPFESGDDAEDTIWGKRAASYKKQYPDSPSITVKIKIFISQMQ